MLPIARADVGRRPGRAAIRGPAALALGRALGAVGLVLGAVGAGCAGPQPESGLLTGEEEPATPVLADIETLQEMRVDAHPAGTLAERLTVTVSIRPKDDVLLELRGTRPSGEPGNDALLLLRVGRTDYLGVTPSSYGGSETVLLPFGGDGEARRGAPLERTFEVELPVPEDRVLARRVTVSGQLHPVEVVVGDVRSGGTALPLPAVEVATARRPSATADLDALLAQAARPDLPEEDAANLFLRCAGVAADGAPPDEHVGRLIEALPGLAPRGREAVYGTLLYLTGETRGHAVHRWQAWWDEQRRRRGATGGP